jgi:hypothetical protein
MIRFDAGTPRPHPFASARKLGISFYFCDDARSSLLFRVFKS